MPLSAVDSITPAFEHAKQQLFRPFRFGQWAKLAFVGFLAGELGSGGGGGPNFNIPSASRPSHDHFRALPHLPHINPALLIPLIAILVVAVLVLWLLFIYISSRMRFVLFDSVIEKNCEIGRMWRARREAALRYFVWQLLFALVSVAGFGLLIGVPVLMAFLMGWFSAPRQHILGLILGGFALFCLFGLCLIAVVAVHVFTKDFVVPQMAFEDVTAFEGWRRLLRMIQSDKGGYAAYAGMKIVLALGAAFLIAFAAIIVVLVLLIPVGGLGFIAIMMGKTAGLSWNVFTVTIAVVAGCMLVLLLLYLISLISVPAIVFFPAYSIYFFASRYPQLARAIYPPPPPAPPLAPVLEPIV